MEKKIIWSSGVSALITSILLIGGLSLDNPNNYGCEARGIVMPCDSLSQYYSLPNGKCNNAELGNKLCSTGWTKNFKIHDEQSGEGTLPSPDCAVKVIAYTNTKKYYCDGIGPDAKCIS